MLFLRYYLWVVPHLLLGVLLVLALRKKLQKQLPIFLLYAAFELFQFVVLFTLVRFLGRSPLGVYRWFLLCGAALSSLLQLAVLYELAQTLIFSRASLSRLVQQVFTWSMAALLIIAAVVSGVLGDVSRERVMNLFQIVDFSSSLIQAGMLLVLFLFSRALHISWRSWPMGVALGFGLSACVTLAAAAFRPSFGNASFIAVDVTGMAAFHVAVLVWLAYLYLPDSTPTSTGLRESDIQFWEQELQRITSR